MSALIYYVAGVALAAAFFLALARKWGWLEWMQVHSNGFFNKLLNCHFCTTFWMCAALTAILVPVTGYIPAIACPILATPIAVRLW